MRQLIIWELKLLLQQRIIYAVLLLIACFIFLGHSVIDTSDQSAYDQLEGPIGEQDVEEATKILASIEAGSKELSNTDNPYYTILFAEKLSVLQDDAINGLENELVNTSNNVEIKEEIQFRDNVNVMYLTNFEFPDIVIEYLSGNGVTFIGILLLVGLYAIFSRDDATGVSQYTLTSKYGRTKLVTAKIIIASLYTIVVYASITTIIWIYNLYRASANMSYWSHAFKGWDAPIQFLTSLATSPYALSAMEYHAIQLGLLLLGSIALTLIFLVVSSLCKSSFTSFLLCAGIFFIPIVIVDIVKAVPYIKWLDAIYPYSLTYIMKVESLFESFRSIHIGSLVILAPYLAFGIAILTILCSILFIKWYFRNQKVI
ncbi:ABC transporter permease subunit [Psychrobacillus sp. OK032]|uniref:ABC transporter permease subunit n=1 Tax=Psychrobacillus sp. OK032 TaxID=1884358 RepID=UPI0008D24D7E|nr:ABC transporter permease subunit [Psychrobacillus sp. OK032]SES45374.1 ABC-2 family transporter protein [Psychrobacillus sp. OK032]